MFHNTDKLVARGKFGLSATSFPKKEAKITDYFSNVGHVSRHNVSLNLLCQREGYTLHTSEFFCHGTLRQI